MTEPRSDRILAILTVRNEGAFLLEWLAHHRACGFTDFLVISNDCQDGTDLMLDRLQDLGNVVHLRNDGPHDRGPQWSALKLANGHDLRHRADWIAVLDIDEFVNIHAGDHTIGALLSALPEADAITLTWRLFGNAGIRDFVDRPVREQFTRAAPAVMGWPWRAAMFKTLFRNDGTYARLGVHRPRGPDKARLDGFRWFDGSGRRLGGAFLRARVYSDYGRDNYRLVQLNHYALGAMQSYVLKCDRGRANRDASAFDLSYWVERNFNQVEDRSILALDGAVRAHLSALKSDPDLAALHDRAVAWRQQRFEQLMTQEHWRALFGRLIMTPPSRVLTPEEHALITGHALRARKQS